MIAIVAQRLTTLDPNGTGSGGAKGGRCGNGNKGGFCDFKPTGAPTPTRPQPGTPGEERCMQILERKMIADACLHRIAPTTPASRSTQIALSRCSTRDRRTYPFTTNVSQQWGCHDLNRRASLLPISRALIEGAHTGVGFDTNSCGMSNGATPWVHLIEPLPPVGDPLQNTV